MVNNMLIYAAPALASAAVAGLAWRTKPGRAALHAGRAAAISVGRAAVQRWIPVALAALISTTIGVLVYLGHALDVSSGQALHGAVIAVVASILALAGYWALGIVARHFVTVFGVWALSLMPLYYYAFLAWIAVAGYTQCGPQAYECPI